MKELLESHPKTAEKIKIYYKQLIKGQIKNISLDGIDLDAMLQSFSSNEQLAKMFNPRGLFDFFDENGVYIEIQVDDSGNKIVFRGYIMNILEDSPNFNTRTEAENFAVIEAFRILENKL